MKRGTADRKRRRSEGPDRAVFRTRAPRRWRSRFGSDPAAALRPCSAELLHRERDGREAIPTLAIIDAQSVKCDAPQGERGYDAGKKVLGRKRHLVVDSGGRLLAVSVTPANVQDQDGGLALVKRLVRLYPWVETIVVDGGYKKRFIDAVQSGLKRAVEVVLRPEGSKGFVLLPKRWRVEQSIGVLTGSRRLKVDYETLPHVSAGAMLFASIGRMLASITMN